ncbi:Avr4-2 [Pseudocercospora musae]|uniref:Avr4-2 n=1 Tax=Pseudocercospora musae TaxID=113226 RepID=A0A139GU59_9PEZI|nr:Avr4-2 [Pseudocercospora musae]
MRSLISLLLLINISIAANPKPFTCPPKDFTATKCQGPADCLYTDPMSCLGYIQCVCDNDACSTATPYTKSCPKGLAWVDELKRCDGMEKSACPKKVVGERFWLILTMSLAFLASLASKRVKSIKFVHFLFLLVVVVECEAEDHGSDGSSYGNASVHAHDRRVTGGGNASFVDS